MKKYLWVCCIAIIMLLFGAEIGARVIGLNDFPLHDANPTIGYAFKPNQEGSFLGHNWVYNDQRMGVRRDYEPSDDAIIILGDSVLNGGVWTDQEKRLGPQLSKKTDRPAWPLSAGSWGVENEIIALRAVPEWQRAQNLVFVLNSGDFKCKSVWVSDYYNPTQRPMSAIFYAVGKKLGEHPAKPPCTPDSIVWQNMLRDVLRDYDGELVWVLYPTKSGEADFSPLAGFLDRGTVVDISKDPKWSPEYYRDDIHPNEAGNAYLAQTIAHRLK